MRGTPLLLLLLCLATSSVVAGRGSKPSPPPSHGKCGHQCTPATEQADCNIPMSSGWVPGCGTLSKCSCPDASTKYPSISCTCVSAPANPPSSPAANVEDSVWPSQWNANVSAYVYSDFSDKAAGAHGKFYYDGVGGHSRADWTPYTNQKDATQVWIGSTGSAGSHYYVKSGPLCISFPITDPGSVGGPVGVERADWVKHCNASGMNSYMGREQVTVDGEKVWVDHYSCHVEYTEVNQSITFQNWHSLGLGSLPKGLPLRVTGGNSHPNGQKGSPRLSTVWYSGFTTGNQSVNPKDFVKPSFLCIPVATETTEAFFGHRVTRDHVFDPSFHKRAHSLPMHVARQHSDTAPTARDIKRAVQKIPGPKYSGKHFFDAMTGLNAVLEAEKGLETRACDQFSIEELHAVQRVLFEARSPEFQQVYTSASDTRSLMHATSTKLEEEQAAVEQLMTSRPEVANMVRDGVCHQTVMWYVHHLAEGTKEEVKQLIVLPLLPKTYHKEPLFLKDPSVQVGHKRYKSQVSCAVCHIAP